MGKKKSFFDEYKFWLIGGIVILILGTFFFRNKIRQDLPLIDDVIGCDEKCPTIYYGTCNPDDFLKWGFDPGCGCVLRDDFSCPTEEPCMPKPVLYCDEIKDYSGQIPITTTLRTTTVGVAPPGGYCWDDDDCNNNIEYCDFEVCVAETGRCTFVPSSCPFIYEPVCGCDGRTYSNDCARQMNRISKSHDGEC